MASFGMSGLVFHGPLLQAHPGFLLKSVLQRTKDTAKAHYPQTEVVRSFDDLLKDDAIELVIVNATNETHYPMARAALEAGKHVVLEKPFTNTVKEGLQLVALAARKGKVLSAFQNRRWDSDFLTVQKIINEKLLGRVVEFVGNFDRYRNYIQENTWKEESGPGSGLLYNLGPHLIDQVFVLFGAPSGVWGDIRKIRSGTRVDDYFDITLHYEGVKARVHSSYLVREPYPRFVLHGTEGSFVKYGLDKQEADLKAGLIPGTAGWGVEPEGLWGILNTTINTLPFRGRVESEPGNYLSFYDNIYEAIRNKKPLEVPAMESLWNVYAIELARESAKKGKMMPFDKSIFQ